MACKTMARIWWRRKIKPKYFYMKRNLAMILEAQSLARLQSWALFAEISGAESLGEIGAGA
jgi:hypothetical protein